MFNDPMLWEEIGYTVKHGQLAKGQPVALERTPETSPIFLEDHSDINDIVQFIPFEDEFQQDAWLLQQIQKNLAEDELRHDDIMVIHPDSLTARQSTGFIRKSLFEAGIQAHLAGVDTDADVFFRTDTRSVTRSLGFTVPRGMKPAWCMSSMRSTVTVPAQGLPICVIVFLPR